MLARCGSTTLAPSRSGQLQQHYLDTGDFASHSALQILVHLLATSSIHGKLQISGSNNIVAVDQTGVVIPAYVEEEIDFTVTILNAPFSQHPRLIRYVGTMDSS